MTLTQIAAETMGTLLKRHGRNYNDVADMLGRSRAYVALRMQAVKAWDTDELERIGAWLGEDPSQFYTGVQYRLAAAA